jgi:hypothetical protein
MFTVVVVRRVVCTISYVKSTVLFYPRIYTDRCKHSFSLSLHFVDKATRRRKKHVFG